MNSIFNFFKNLFGSKKCTKNLSTCKKEDCCMMVKEVEIVEEPKLELITDVMTSKPLNVVEEVKTEEVAMEEPIKEEVAKEVEKKPKRKYNKKPKADNTKKEVKVSKKKKDDK